MKTDQVNVGKEHSGGVATEFPLDALERRVAVLETAVQIALSGLIGILEAATELNLNVSKNQLLMQQLEALCGQLAQAASEQRGTSPTR